jgi:regulator of replication initiation timing
MSIDLPKFAQAINPASPLQPGMYIDFSGVRGGPAIDKLFNRISRLSPDRPTCALFTGHIGCGKSTELMRLQKKLEEDGFFVVYFESSTDLELADVDIVDVLLVIARRITEQLGSLKVQEPKGFKHLLHQAANLLQTDITASAKVNVPGMGTIVASTEGSLSVETAMGNLNATLEEGISISAGIGAVTLRAKNDSGLRQRLNQYLGPQKTELLRLINAELIEPAIVQLKAQGKKGLAVIVDNLDRIDNRVKTLTKRQDEYLFVDQGDILNKLQCHVVYTMPLALRFSNEYGNLLQRFSPPQVLPMVLIRHQDGRDCEEGIALLKQMVLSRVFPNLSESDRLAQVTEIFDEEDSLDYLCRMSGGHVRDLLRMLSEWLEEEMDLPLTRDTLEDVLSNSSSEMKLRISEQEWDKLRQVKATQRVSDELGYDDLIRSRMVFEYQEKKVSWFAVNPLLLDSPELG